MKASFLQSTFKPGDVEIRQVSEMLDAIKNGDYKKEIEKVRQEPDLDKRQVLKKNTLSGVVWMGRFSYRQNDGLLESNGLAILDFDHLKNAPVFRDSLKEDDWVFSAWVSPSGDGVKALVRIPNVTGGEEYKEYYKALTDHYKDAKSDKQTNEIARLCYNSYDPDLWVNESATIWEDKIIVKSDTRDLPDMPYYYNENEIFDKLEKWLENKGEMYYKGNRNFYVFKFAAACNRFGVVRSSCLGYSTSNFDLPEQEIKQTVNSAYKHTVDHGTARFENKAEFAKIVSKVNSGEGKTKVLKQIIDDGINPKEAEKVYEKAVQTVNDKLETFWETKMKNNKVTLESRPMKYIDWLNAAGFYKYYYSNNDYMLVKVNRNIVTETTIDRIRIFVQNYVNNLPFQFDMITREQLYEFVFIKAEKQYFGSSTIELLHELPINFVKDSKNKAYLFFKNTAIEITKDIIIPFKFEELDGYIWENQIIKREYKEDNKSFKNFEFNKFMRNITGNEKNYNSLKTIAGYMLHGYKNPALSIAPILNDCILTDGINGGTGKGLFVKALGHIKPMITFDAKNWDINKDFAFQRVNLDTDIIFIDDVQSNFDFEKLFSVITEGISVNKKNKPEFYISYDESPKIIIATNYAIAGDGNSHERRKVEIEFIKYYHKGFTPADEFKHYFYKDWDEQGWSDFDNLMIHCIQYYMETGLQESIQENLAVKKLISATSEVFVEWINNKDTFETNTQYNIKELFEDFIDYTGYTKTNIGYLGKLLKEYAKFKKLPYISERVSQNGGKITYVSIGEPLESQDNSQDKLPF